jgi:hypothetical protein
MGRSKIARWAKTLFAWLFVLASAGLHFGKAVLVGVDQGSNLYAVKEYLDKARMESTVNLGSLLLFLFGASGATVITMWIWRVGPFKVLEQVKGRHSSKVDKPESSAQTVPADGADEVPSASSQVVSMESSADALRIALPGVLGPDPLARLDLSKPITVKMPSSKSEPHIFTVATGDGDIQVKSIAVPRQIAFQHFIHGGEYMFRVSCTVDYYGLRATSPSPYQLRLQVPGGRGDVARMRTATTDGTVPRCPCSLRFEGEGRWALLQEAAERTMPVTGLSDPLPWKTMPPRGTLYCNLELHLPDGLEFKAHQESQVKFAFELAGKHCKPITVRIDPWSIAETDDPPVSITLL